MKRFSLCTMICALALLLSDSYVQAQPPGGRQRPGGGGQAGPGSRTGRGQQGGGRGQGMRGPGAGGQGAQMTPPLLRVFDADGDGELSPTEIDAAAMALRKLDHDKNGRLTAEELRPSGSGTQQGRPGQQRGGQGQQRGGSGQQRGAMQGGRPGDGGRGGDPARGDAAFAQQVMELDENKNGTLSNAELPEHMHTAFTMADANKDGELDDAEQLVLASQFRRNKLSPHGESPVNTPTQGRRPTP